MALVTSSSVMLVYLFLGGMKSVIKTDSVQYGVMLFLTFITAHAMFQKTDLTATLFSFEDASIGLIISFILYGVVSPFYSAHTWQRVYAVKNDASVKWGLVGAGIFIVILGTGVTLIGLAAKAAFPSIVPEEAAAYGMAHLLTPGFMGLGLVILFAAVMSSIDTLVFYLASSLAKDMQSKTKGVQEDVLQTRTRVYIVLITCAGIVCAYFFRNLVDIMLTFGGISIAVVPPAFFSFHYTLKDNAVSTGLIAAALYAIGLLIAGMQSPGLVLVGLLVSGGVMGVWQKWGR